LRDEARVRLQRVQTQLPSKLPPRYLWKLDAQQKYALVVDTSRSTLYVYENVNGEPRYVADYYITIGKLGTEKVSEGDKRTPIGVYFVKANLPKNKLADMYGSGAYPLSYPNEWDRKNGRTGQGIWLHGTPSDTYSRPPRASDGCVVLANDDLDKLAPYLQVGITPVIITNQVDWANEQDQIERDALLQEIEQWRKDWSSLDTKHLPQTLRAQFFQRQHGFRGVGETETSDKQCEVVDQGRSLECQRVYLPGAAQHGGGKFRAGLQQQQPVQPHEEAPILDQTEQSLADYLRRSRMI